VLTAAIERGWVSGLAHITGGGITENLPRILPPGIGAQISRRSCEVPALFRFLQDAGRVPADDMWRTFNMGIGMILACTPAVQDDVLGYLRTQGENASVIGTLVQGAGITYRD
jgi:phosphoribosylformylglycinamidine cyclo-ligase